MKRCPNCEEEMDEDLAEEGICSECGLTFAWRDVCSPDYTRSSRLFEHALRCGKQVRTDTGVGTLPAAIPAATGHTPARSCFPGEARGSARRRSERSSGSRGARKPYPKSGSISALRPRRASRGGRRRFLEGRGGGGAPRRCVRPRRRALLRLAGARAFAPAPPQHPWRWGHDRPGGWRYFHALSRAPRD